MAIKENIQCHICPTMTKEIPHLSFKLVGDDDFDIVVPLHKIEKIKNN